MSEPVLLSLLRFAGLTVFVVACWSVWVRRLTFGSRYDMPVTIAVALFGVGAALDAPWSAIAAASYPLTGRYYLLNAAGHLCYIAGAAISIGAVYRRLLPDDDIEPFVRRVVLPIAGGSALTMIVAIFLSRATTTLTADHLYVVAPDGWMKLYWLAHFGATSVFGAIACYGVLHLRRDPRGVWLNLLLTSLAVAAAAGGAFGGWVVITGRVGPAWLLAWLLTYAAFASGAIATALQWMTRQQTLLRPP